VLDACFDAASVGQLRERAEACATAGGVANAKALDVTIVVHELAANAVRHGAGTGQLLLHAGNGALCCQVSDSGPGPAVWPLRHGHGLWLVHQVADEVRVVSDPAGFRVTVLFASQG
jgi:anti-sigma regulatory factor (Ser/Thr protein kinase)